MGCFYLSATVNNAAVNIDVQTSLQDFVIKVLYYCILQKV